MKLRLLLLTICLLTSRASAQSNDDPAFDRFLHDLVQYHAKHPDERLGLRRMVHTEDAQGSGGEADAHGDATKALSKMETPAIALPSGATGGSATSNTSVSAAVATDPIRIFFGIVAVLCAGGCVWFVYRKRPGAAAQSAIAAGAFAAAAIWPALALLIVGIGFALHYGGHFLTELFHPDAIKQAASDAEKRLEKLRAKLPAVP